MEKQINFMKSEVQKDDSQRLTWYGLTPDQRAFIEKILKTNDLDAMTLSFITDDKIEPYIGFLLKPKK